MFKKREGQYSSPRSAKRARANLLGDVDVVDARKDGDLPVSPADQVGKRHPHRLPVIEGNGAGIARRGRRAAEEDGRHLIGRRLPPGRRDPHRGVHDAEAQPVEPLERAELPVRDRLRRRDEHQLDLMLRQPLLQQAEEVRAGAHPRAVGEKAGQPDSPQAVAVVFPQRAISELFNRRAHPRRGLRLHTPGPVEHVRNRRRGNAAFPRDLTDRYHTAASFVKTTQIILLA